MVSNSTNGWPNLNNSYSELPTVSAGCKRKHEPDVEPDAEPVGESEHKKRKLYHLLTKEQLQKMLENIAQKKRT